MGLFDKFRHPAKPQNIIEDYELANVIHRKVNEHLWLHPYDEERLINLGELDAQLLTVGTNDAESKEFLPGLSISKESLHKRVVSVELGIGISYLIALDKMPIGMIELTLPKRNKIQNNMTVWSLDFFIVNYLRDKGVMSSCFPAFMKLMVQNIGIKEVYAWVHEDNLKSISVLEKFFFRVVDTIQLHDSTKRPIISPHYMAWKCPLQELVFADGQIRCPSYWADRPTLVY